MNRVKIPNRDIQEINYASFHEFWEGGVSSLRTFTGSEGYPRALRVDADGTLIMTDHDDTSVTYNVVKGEILNVSPKTISASSTADVQIWW